VTRPRAADDFAVIRARLDELRRERAQVAADDEPERAMRPPLYFGRGPLSQANEAKPSPPIRRAR
jgi:hypothetical protein